MTWNNKCVQEVLHHIRMSLWNFHTSTLGVTDTHLTDGNRKLKFGTNFMRGGGDVT